MIFANLSAIILEATLKNLNLFIYFSTKDYNS
jgi:hypothetical protein